MAASRTEESLSEDQIPPNLYYILVTDPTLCLFSWLFCLPLPCFMGFDSWLSLSYRHPLLSTHSSHWFAAIAILISLVFLHLWTFIRMNSTSFTRSFCITLVLTWVCVSFKNSRPVIFYRSSSHTQLRSVSLPPVFPFPKNALSPVCIFYLSFLFLKIASSSR